MESGELIEKKEDESLNFFSIFDQKIASKYLHCVPVLVTVTAKQAEQLPAVAPAVAPDDTKILCTTCGVVRQFGDRREQVVHYKSDWHLYNLKRRLNGQMVVDQKVYEERSMRECASGDDLSSNGSSDEMVAAADQQESEWASVVHRHARLFFHDESGYSYSVYKCIILSKMEDAGTLSDQDLMTRIGQIQACPKWAVILLGGGHFAAAVFNGQDVVIQKTFHRYVVRAKQGSMQSTHDRNRPAASSAGAALRRHNEQALEAEIRRLLIETWKDHLQECGLIFYRSAGLNRRILFGSGKKSAAQVPFRKDDKRLRNIPFATRRATFKEVVRVHVTLCTIECHGLASELSNEVQADQREQKQQHPSPKKQSSKTSKKSYDQRSGKSHQATVSEPTLNSDSSDGEEFFLETEEVVCDFAHLKTSEIYSPPRPNNKNKNSSDHQIGELSTSTSCNRLYTACKLGQLEVIREIVESEPNVEALLNRPFGKMNNTFLHVLARAGRGDAVTVLLENGADPISVDSMGRPPYSLTDDVETRKQFRRFRAKYPDRYDYKAAKIPAPLSEEDERRKAERQRILRGQRRQRVNEQKIETKERNAFLNLSDANKTNTAVSGPRCFTCGESLQGKIPFEYDQFKFCKIPCVKEHRLKSKK